MRVLHVESGRHLYGGAWQVLLLLRGLRAEGVENILVCPRGSAIAAARPAADLRDIPMGGDVDLGMIGRLRRVIKDTQPDILHLHSRRGADWLGGLASLRLGMPVVLSRRVDNRERRLFARVKYAPVDRIVAISQDIRRVLREAGISDDKIVCVPSGIPPGQSHARDRDWFEQQFAVPVDSPVIGVIAQLIPRKGHRVLLEALPALLRVAPDLRVVFFGRGAEEASLRKHITELGLGHVASLPGFRDDLQRILPCLDLVVHPALSEGLGVSLLLASQAGLAVVASRTGGIPEAVIDGETGLLVPPGDIAALTAAVSSLLADPARCRQFGEAGKRHIARRFSVEQMVAGNLAVYRSI